MTRFLRLVGLAGFLLCFSSRAFAGGDHPYMEDAINLLKTALTSCEGPAAKQTPKEQVVLVLTAAKESANKAPPVYHGRRTKAMEFMDAAIAELKAGDKDKCAS